MGVSSIPVEPPTFIRRENKAAASADSENIVCLLKAEVPFRNVNLNLYNAIPSSLQRRIEE